MNPESPEANHQQDLTPPLEFSPISPTEAPPSYVKLAMRNMVKKRGTSLFHFVLTSVGLVAVLVGLSVAFH